MSKLEPWSTFLSVKSAFTNPLYRFLWNHFVHTQKECIFWNNLDLLHNLWSFVIERSPGRQIFMVSFWFQGELVFHAPGDRASYQLFQTFFESLNHSRNENNTFFGNGRKYLHLYVSLIHTFGCSLCFLFLCLRRLLDDLQEKLYCSQMKGFSPVCLRLCIFRWEGKVQE